MQLMEEGSWSYFKELVSTKSLSLQYVDTETEYRIYASEDYTYLWFIVLQKGSDDAIDFETNYKSEANKPMILNPNPGHSQFVGRKIEIAGNEESGYCEWADFEADVFMSKILPITVDGVFGDYIELEVWTKDDAQMVSRYADTVYIYNGKPDVWFQGGGVARIPPVVKVRCVYHKVAGDTNPRKFIAIGEFILQS